MFRTLALLAPYFVGGKAVKIKPGSILIFGVGAAVAIGLATWQHSNWYLFVLAPFAVWAWLYSVEEINKLSWHYKFTECYFEQELKGLCKTCPYYGLFALAVVFYLIQLTYLTVLQLATYLWHTLWLMLGLRPQWNVLTYHRIHHNQDNQGYLYKRHIKPGYTAYDEMTVTWVRPVFSALVVLPAVITLLAMHIIQPPLATFYHGQPVYFTAPATYLAVLAVAGLMELWLAVGWPLVKLAYDKGCPDAKFVEKQRVPAKPQMPPTARPN